jgi:hypothetical protein
MLPGVSQVAIVPVVCSRELEGNFLRPPRTCAERRNRQTANDRHIFHSQEREGALSWKSAGVPWYLIFHVLINRCGLPHLISAHPPID